MFPRAGDSSIFFQNYKLVSQQQWEQQKSNHIFCTEHLMRKINLNFLLYLDKIIDMENGCNLIFQTYIEACWYHVPSSLTSAFIHIRSCHLMSVCVSLLASACASSLLDVVFLTISNVSKCYSVAVFSLNSSRLFLHGIEN